MPKSHCNISTVNSQSKNRALGTLTYYNSNYTNKECGGAPPGRFLKFMISETVSGGFETIHKNIKPYPALPPPLIKYALVIISYKQESWFLYIWYICVYARCMYVHVPACTYIRELKLRPKIPWIFITRGKYIREVAISRA